MALKKNPIFPTQEHKPKKKNKTKSRKNRNSEFFAESSKLGIIHQPSFFQYHQNHRIPVKKPLKIQPFSIETKKTYLNQKITR